MKSEVFFTIFMMISAVVMHFPCAADEGMWEYKNLPLEKIKKAYGFELTDKWTERVMKASVRFNNGGSGSFISSDGLVMTNHHVAADALQKLSTPEHNYYEKGFCASKPEDEANAPDLELNQLVSIEDVTQRVNSVVKPEMTPAQANEARKSEMAKIEKESLDSTGLRSDVVTLYEGGLYHLYRYKQYTDVRLVFAPEFGAAFFGGDPDNFEYPRYDLDISIFRVYENHQPVKIDTYFSISKKGVSENELIFVSGNPGSTKRMFTVAALEFERDVRLPDALNYLRRLEVLLQLYSQDGPEHTRQAKEDLFSVQNARKAYMGMLRGLQDPKLIDVKEAGESQLRSRVGNEPNLQTYASAWDEVAKAQRAYRKIYTRYFALEKGRGFNSRLFQIARMLVRMTTEDRKPNEKRLEEYRASGRKSLELELFSEAPIYAELEKTKLADSLSYLAEKLGSSDILVLSVLHGQGPSERAAELISNTRLESIAFRKELAKGGYQAVQSSRDPMIILARLVDKPARAIRNAYEKHVQSLEREAYSKIAKAEFAIFGTNTYPDATFTLRLSYGAVRGYQAEGKAVVAPFTTIEGAFKHEEAHDRAAPWKLPESWHKNKDALNLKTPLNFVSTADVVGGNSGSPVINRDLELVGVIFDGNIYSLTGDYIYDERLNRAISVDSRSILEMLQKIYCPKMNLKH